jgi:glutamate synthase (NADPH/NADH) large chain
MTGGTVVVLGNTGRNFAAGMSGVAYVYDRTAISPALQHRDGGAGAGAAAKEQEAQSATFTSSTRIWPRSGRSDPQASDRAPLQAHRQHACACCWITGPSRSKFVKVFPNEYKRALAEMAEDVAPRRCRQPTCNRTYLRNYRG